MTAAAAVRADFTGRLYDKLATAEVGKNAFLSPFSIQAALAMCAAGAGGATRHALAGLLGAPPSVDDQNRQYAARLRSIAAAGDQHVQLTIANALWGQLGARFHAAYQQAIADYYGGELCEVDFQAQPDQAVKTINAWVATKTEGKIQELIGRGVITPLTRLILTNAVYFKGKWAYEFDPSHTWEEDWHGAGGVRKVPMMQQRRGYLYCESADFQALDLPYRGEQLSLLVVLPRKMDGLAALESKWGSAGLMQKAVDSLAHEPTVILSLPRFKMAAAYQLKPVLCAMGGESAFGADADFSGISAEPLQIAEVIHKAYVEVNEEGTEAAAATGVVMAKCAATAASEPKSFRADHPFFFAIRDRQTNSVLFCGRVLEP